MSKRLQIILPDDEYQAVAQAARRQGKPLARVVCEGIRRMLAEEGGIEQAHRGGSQLGSLRGADGRY